MYSFIVQVQAAAVYFSLCQAWSQLDPADQFLHQDFQESTRTLEQFQEYISSRRNTLELVENFTEFLQKKQQNEKMVLEEQARARNLYIANIWSQPIQEGTISTIKTTEATKITKYDEKLDKIYNLDVGSNLYKSPDVVFKFSTKKTLAPMRNTIFSDITKKFRLEDLDEGKDSIYNLLDGQNIRRIGKDDKDIFNDVSTLKPEIELAKIFNKGTTRDENENLLKHISGLTVIANASTKRFVLHNFMKKTTPKISTKNKPKPKIQLNKMGARKIEMHKKYNKLKQKNQKNNKAVTSTNAKTNKPKTVKTTTKIDDHKVKYEKILKRENQIFDILKKQSSLLEKVARILNVKDNKQSIRTQTDFDSLLEELDLKRQKIDDNLNMTQVAVNSVKEKLMSMYMSTTKTPPTLKTSKSTRKSMLPTIKTVIDETEVRKALKNDPYVQRILKMAKRKREEYMKKATKTKT